MNLPPPPPADATATERFEDGLPTITGRPPGGSAALPMLAVRVAGISLDGEIGRGASGLVFRGRRDADGAVVAVKMLRRHEPDDPRELARFVAEAAAVAGVSHPNVARTLAYGESAGRPYLVLDYCDGGSLAQRLRRDGPLPPADAAKLLAAVADGLHAVHRAGVVHRDVKPGNVLFAADGAPKLADFGLAKRATTSTDLTGTRAVLGSPAYMAPEQARGESKFVGPPTDVWAAGVVLYECLTGALPFAGPDPLAVLKRVAEDDPTPVRRLNPAVPRDLALVVEKCLQKEMSERYPTAAALAADLRAVLAGKPVSARGLGPLRRAWRQARRHPLPSLLAAGLVLSLAAGAVTSTALAVRYRAEQTQTAALLEQVRAERQATWDALDALTDQAVERQIARQPVATTADREFLRQVLVQYERAVGRYEDGAGARRMIAHGRYRVARLRQRLGEVAEAEAGYRAGADGFRAALELEPTSANGRHGLANCLEQLGWLLSGVGRHAEAEAVGREAVALRRAEADPLRLGKATNTLGLVLNEAGNLEEARALFRESVTHLEAAGEPGRGELARGRANLASALSLEPEHVAEAEAGLRASLADYDVLLAADPTNPRDRLAACRARVNLGRLLARRGDDGADDEYAAGVALSRGLTAEFPGYPDHQHELARGLTLWAAVADPADAVRMLDEALAHHRRAVQAKPDGRHYRAALAENRRQAAERALARGDHAAAVAAADEFAAVVPVERLKPLADKWRRQAAAVVRWDWRLTPAERAAAAERYTAGRN